MVAYYPIGSITSRPAALQGRGPASVVFSKAPPANVMTTLGLSQAGWMMWIRLVRSIKHIWREYSILDDNCPGVLLRIRQNAVLLRDKNVVVFHERDVR